MAKEQLQAAGAKLVDLILALSDGAGVDDIDEGTAFLVSLAGVAGEIADDADSALLDILAGAASALADNRRDQGIVQ